MQFGGPMRAKEICVIYMISRKTCASAVLAFRPYISKGNQPAELFCFIALLLPATHRFQSFRYLRSVNTPSPCKTVKLARYSESTTVVVAEPVNEEADSESKTCGKILVFLSWVLVCLTMPFSLFICFKAEDDASLFIPRRTLCTVGSGSGQATNALTPRMQTSAYGGTSGVVDREMIISRSPTPGVSPKRHLQHI
ncbi:unnamed protein product [Spodoptera exigua]|nr:unnamed protein product [Spodoptera exigua]